MKHFLSILAVTLLLSAFVHAQEKVNFETKFEIPKSKIESKQVKNKTVQYVNPQNLKPGYNYIVLKSGNILYVEYSNSQIKSFTLTNAKGISQGKPILPNTVTQFQCSAHICACTGDADCNDMFSTNSCGPNAVCFGNSCICTR